jgi:hypothetical protein
MAPLTEAVPARSASAARSPINEALGLARSAAYLLPLMLLVVVLGFWPGYFMDLRNTRASVHIHGALMLTWMVALIAQALLIRTTRLEWHRRIGYLSFVLAPLIVVMGLFVTQGFIARAGSEPTRLHLEIFTISLVSIVSFGLVYGLAIAWRHEPRKHARYMIGTGLLLIGAGLLRLFLNWIPWLADFTTANHATLGLVEVATIALLANDRRTGQIRAPFLVVLGLTVFLHLMFWRAPESTAWRDFAVRIGQM